MIFFWKFPSVLTFCFTNSLLSFKWIAEHNHVSMISDITQPIYLIFTPFQDEFLVFTLKDILWKSPSVLTYCLTNSVLFYKWIAEHNHVWVPSVITRPRAVPVHRVQTWRPPWNIPRLPKRSLSVSYELFIRLFMTFSKVT